LPASVEVVNVKPVSQKVRVTRAGGVALPPPLQMRIVLESRRAIKRATMADNDVGRTFRGTCKNHV